MKKQSYIAPKMEVVVMSSVSTMLAGSGDIPKHDGETIRPEWGAGKEYNGDFSFEEEENE